MEVNNKSKPNINYDKITKFYSEVCNKENAKTRIRILGNTLSVEEIEFLSKTLNVEFEFKNGEIINASLRR